MHRRNNRTTKRPGLRFSNETGSDRIGQDVKAHLRKGVAFTLLIRNT
jgi:hypothetical protein